MTAQQHDDLLLDGVSWTIVGCEGEGLFTPEVHNLQVVPISTGCYRGFVATYEIDDARALRLLRLLISGAARVGDMLVSEVSEVLGCVPRPIAHGDFVLEPIRMAIAFSGRLLVGRDWVPGTGVNMGFQPGWRFESVLDLELRDGELRGQTDVSDVMAGVREGIKSGRIADPDGERGTEEWVQRTFTLDYARSFPG